MFKGLFSDKWKKIPFDEIKKRSKVLVIDDNEFKYLELFKNDGYTIEKWNDIDDLSKLETGYYDIIFLDIQGVGKAISSEQGLGVLKHIKKENPAQIVIVYSDADYSLKFQDSFKKANDTIQKGSDYVEYKEKMDEYLKLRFSKKFYIDQATILLMNSGVNSISEEKLRKIVEKSIDKNNSEYLSGKIKNFMPNEKQLGLALQVVRTGIAIAAAL